MRRFLVALLALVLGLMLSGWLVLATAAAASVAEAAPRVAIPATSYLYRFKLEREVATRFGTTDATARIAAQVHQESRWRADARSPYAEGLAQFTPATGAWLVKDVCPEIGPHDPWDPNWSVRAAVCYDAWLHARVSGASACDRWAFTLSAYNGGLGWVARDQRRASAAGADPARWVDQVELHSSRAKWAITENRDYVRRILLRFEPAYIAAGWPGAEACA